MANSLTMSIMENIHKKAYNNLEKKDNKSVSEIEVTNLNNNEEEILKNILYKNKSKSYLTYPSKESNLKPQSIKSLINTKDQSKYNEKSKEKLIKSIITLKDLANKEG